MTATDNTIVAYVPGSTEDSNIINVTSVAINTGPSGMDGINGEKGDQGDKGLQGDRGIEGTDGLKGNQGVPGAGLPTGGAPGQTLGKESADDYDYIWQDYPGGGDMLISVYDPQIKGIDAFLAANHDYFNINSTLNNGSTKEAIDQLDVKAETAKDNLNVHKADKLNPHNVTITQVGGYTQFEIDTSQNEQNLRITANEAAIQTNSDNITSNTNDIAAHVADVANPHNIQPADIGALENIIDDLTPQLGGDLESKGKNIVLTQADDTILGVVAEKDNGFAISNSETAAIDSAKGGVNIQPEGVEFTGSIPKFSPLAGNEIRQVFCSPNGTIYPVAAPSVDWEENDTDNTVVTFPALTTWVEIPGLTIALPEDVSLGNRLNIAVNLFCTNAGTNQQGTIGISFGINGAQPIGAPVASVTLVGGINTSVPVDLSLEDHGGLLTADTITVWVQRESEAHPAFNPGIDGNVTAHTLAVSVLTGGTAGAHTHSESDIDDLNKYTQAEVDAAISSAISTFFIAGPNPPPVDGATKFWWDTENLQLYVLYEDLDSSQFMKANRSC